MFAHNVLNSVVKISVMFAKYFEYYTIILRGGIFVDMLYIWVSCMLRQSHAEQEGQHPLTGQRAPPISGGT